MEEFDNNELPAEYSASLAELDARLSKEDYDRRVDVAFPFAIADEFQTAGLSAPIRDFLTWLAERNPDEAARLVRIRDAYYAGDHDDDHGDEVSDPNNFPLSTEERALRRAERRATQAEREERRQDIELGFEQYTARQAHIWAPYRDRLQQLDLQLSRLNARWDQLDAEWDAFIIASDAWGTDSFAREAAERTRLADIESAIRADQRAWSDAMCQLRELVNETAYKKAA